MDKERGGEVKSKGGLRSVFCNCFLSIPQISDEYADHDDSDLWRKNVVWFVMNMVKVTCKLVLSVVN